MAKSACFGLPRIGLMGELCREVARVMKTDLSDMRTIASIEAIGAKIRGDNIKMMLDSGIDIIPCNDFSNYDHVLDNSEFIGNVGKRYYWEGGAVPADIHFTMINGQQREKFDVHGMPLRRWFNTNYLYVVPEFVEQLDFAYSDNKPVCHFLEAKQHYGIKTRPVLLGPVSYIKLGTVAKEGGSLKIAEILAAMFPVYSELFQNFARIQVDSIQFDEPFLAKSLTREEQSAYVLCYNTLAEYAKLYGISLHLITSYGSIGNNLECAMSLPVQSIHIDLVHGNDNIDDIASSLPASMVLSVGLVDSQNVFINDLSNSISIAERIVAKIGNDRLVVAPSSSLFLCPLDVDCETSLDSNQSSVISFAKQKLAEVVTITNAINKGCNSVKDELDKNRDRLKLLHGFVDRINSSAFTVVGDALSQRGSFKQRLALQREKHQVSLLPITPVGSMPSDVKYHCTDGLSDDLQKQIDKGIKEQESYLDVVCTGEIERKDNIEYFALLMDKIFVTSINVVQQSGSICAPLPILFDLPTSIRNHHIRIAEYCLTKTLKPLKATLCGPISFVNGCALPLGVDLLLVYTHFAHLFGDELKKLESIGVSVIGLYESSILQHSPMRDEYVLSYVQKIAGVFKLCTNYVSDVTQIDLYAGYLHFEENIDYLIHFDADLLLIESARSKWQVLNSLVSYKYPNNIALGIFEPDSVRVPTPIELHIAIKKILRVLEDDQVWMTTDSGMKSRTWREASTIMSTISSVVNEARSRIK